MRRIRQQEQHYPASPLSPTLGWDINILPVTSNNEIATDYKALHRNDDGTRLSICKKSYHPATNEKFKEVVHKIQDITSFGIHGYSEFGSGRKVVAYLKNNDSMSIGDFTTENYMVVGNSFDGSTGFFTGITNVVMRCSNQFSRMNVKTNIRHTAKINDSLNHLVKFYHDYVEQERSLKKTFENWHGIKVPQELVHLFANNVLEIDNDDNVSAFKVNQRESLFQSVNKEMEAIGNSVYGLFNGLTHYTTHVKKSSEKIFGGVFGNSSRLNHRGYNFLTQYVSEIA